MIAGGNVVEALLAKDKLPADQEAWEAIGAMLKDQEEIDFYESHGFVHDHNVMGVTPCMVKTLSKAVVV